MLEATNNTDLVLLMHFAFCFTLNYLILLLIYCPSLSSKIYEINFIDPPHARTSSHTFPRRLDDFATQTVSDTLPTVLRPY